MMKTNRQWNIINHRKYFNNIEMCLGRDSVAAFIDLLLFLHPPEMNLNMVIQGIFLKNDLYVKLAWYMPFRY